MKTFLNLLLFVFLFANVSAQQDNRIAPLSLDMDAIDLLEMERLDNKALIKAEMELRRPGRAPHFAHTFDIDKSTNDIGTWTTLDDGSVVWRLHIHSDKAESLNLGFSKYRMPSGGSLVIYTPDHEHIMGPFTPADNEEHEQLWTPVIDGDEIIVEVWLKENNRNNFELELKSINHDYIGFNSPVLMSGSCNLDVICGAADGWDIVDNYRDIIQSVAVIALGGGTFCTGFLVNNTAQDCTPLFMTADHCGIGAGNAPSLVTYWNFQNSTCREPGSPASGGNGDGQLNDFNTGSIFRAGSAASDFTIVELDDPVSETANAFRAGFNATTDLATSVIGVHHPSTDEKRISFENDPVHVGVWPGPAEVPNGDHIIVVDWDIGTTEGGSSGSPLFDQDKRVIGQLHGGAAACGNNDYDSYGWFNSSWDGNGTANSRLRDWIDPIDSGLRIIDGKDCNFSVQPDNPIVEICAPSDAVYQLTISDNFVNNVNLSVTGLPANLSATFSNNAPVAGEVVTLTISNTSGEPFGNYPFTVIGDDGIENSTTSLFLELFDAIPLATALVNPTNMLTDVTTNPNFNWQTSSASTYEIEVATDATFSNIIISNPMVADESFVSSTFLEPTTTYFWRVRGNNLCGTGEWSEVRQFTTANIVCGEEFSVNIPINIDEGPPNTITSTLVVNTGGEIVDLDVVDLVGTHSWVNDLTFIIESPEGTSVILVSNSCGDLDDFDVSFNDQATGQLPCPYTDGGTYPPSGSLAAFNGENPQGTWTLTVEDGAGQDGGFLTNWGVAICAIPDNSTNVFPSEVNFSICAGSSDEFDVDLGGGFVAPVSMDLVDPIDGINLTFDPPNPAPGTSVNIVIEVDPTVAPANNLEVGFSVNDVNGSTNSFVNVNVLDEPASSVLADPADGVVGVLTTPTFNWSNPGGYTDLTLVVSTDPNFSTDIVINEALTADAVTFTNTNDLAGSTIYYWQITGINECGQTVSETFSFETEAVLGIDQLGSQYFKLLPNPSQGNVAVNLAFPLGKVIEGEVYHVNGMLLENFRIPSGRLTHDIDLSNFPSGIYVVKLKHDNFIATNKVVLN